MADGTTTKKTRSIALAIIGFVLLIGGAIGLPIFFGTFMPGAIEPLQSGIALADQEMKSAQRAYEAEADIAADRQIEKATDSNDDTLTPAQMPPRIRARVIDPGAGTIGVWLELPAFAPQPVRFDLSSDSLTILFPGTGERRAVPMNDLFGGGPWAIRPGGQSAEHRTTCPQDFKGNVVIEFVHVSQPGGRTVVTERLTVY